MISSFAAAQASAGMRGFAARKSFPVHNQNGHLLAVSNRVLNLVSLCLRAASCAFALR